MISPFHALHWRHNEHDGVLNNQPHDCFLNRLFRHRSKKTSNLRVTGLCEGNSPVTGELPAQRASNAENVSIWWRHYEKKNGSLPPREPYSVPSHCANHYWFIVNLNIRCWMQCLACPNATSLVLLRSLVTNVVECIYNFWPITCHRHYSLKLLSWNYVSSIAPLTIGKCVSALRL